jgi:hypothetical protein
MKKMISIIACMLAVTLFNSACNKTQTNNATVDKVSANNANTTNSTNTASTSPSKASTPAPSAPKDISGEYDISGTNENGAGSYKGTLGVTKRDEVYQFSWDTAGKKYDGVGVQNGSAVGVAFTEGTNGKGCGVVLYKIGADGSLDGKAGYWGVNTSESETATRTSGSDLTGEYDIKGTNPDGKAYTGKLSVKSEGTGYTFKWKGANTFEGFGIKQDDTVAVGLGGKQCGFVSYVVKSDGALDGKWGGYGSTEVGTETAKKK